MLELDKIIFSVSTEELDAAITKISALQTAVSNINKPLENLGKSSAKAEEAIKEVGDATEAAGESMSKVDKILDKQATRMKVLRGQAIELADGTFQMEKGFTSSQASMVASLRTMGATVDQVKALTNSFKQYNDITGVNTFDASANGLSRLQKETRELTRVNELAAKGLGLTREELQFLARDTNALTQAYQSEGKDTAFIAAEVEKLNAKFVETSQIRNRLIAEAKSHEDAIKAEANAAVQAAQLQADSADAMFRNHMAKQEQIRTTHSAIMKEMRDFYKQQEKEANLSTKTTVEGKPMDQHVAQYYKQQEKAANDAAKATAYLEREMKRAESALSGLNEDLNISSSNRLLRFKEGLAASGIASEEAARRYEAYSRVIIETDRKRAAQQKSDEQSRINNLSRGLAPQISDVAVSLYGGMSPMTVLMQQGLQVRDLIQSSGVEANKLNEVLKKTGADFIGTIGGTFKAVGSLAVGVFQSAGEGILKFTTDMLGLDKASAITEASLRKVGYSAEEAAATVARFSGIVSTAIGVTLAATTTALLAYAAAMYSVAKEQTALAEISVKSGGALGIVTTEAQALVKSVSDLGITSSTATSILAEMGKSGVLSAESFRDIATAAGDAQKYIGISVEDTVKNFADLAKDPVKTLTEFGIKTGYVTAEQIKMVEALVKAGSTAEANAVAVDALKDAYVGMANEAKGSISGLDKALTDLKSLTSSLWDTFKNSDSVVRALTAISNTIKTIAEGIALTTLGMKSVAVIAGVINAPKGVGLDQAWAAAKDQLQGYADEHQKYREQLWGEQKQYQGLSSEQKKQNSEAVQGLEAQAKLRKALNIEVKDQAKELTRSQYITLQLDKAIREAGQGAVVTMKEMQQASKKFGEEWDTANKPKKTKAGKTEEEKQLERFIKLRGDLADKDRELTSTYTEDLAIIQKYAKTEEERVLLIEQLLKQQPLYTKGEQERAKALRDSEKAAKENSIAFEKFIKGLEDTSKAGRDLENIQKELNLTLSGHLEMLALEATLIGASEEERKKILKSKELELKLNKELLAIDKSNADKPTKDKAIADANRRYIDGMKGLNTEIANDAAKKLVAAYQNIENDLANSVTTAFTNGLDAGFKSLGDTISKEFSRQLKDDLDSLLKNSGAGQFVKENIGYLQAINTAFTKNAQGGRDYGKAAGQAIGFAMGGPLGAAIVGSLGKALGIVDYGGTYHTGGVGGYSAAGGTKTGSAATGLRFGVDPKDYDDAATASAVSFSKALSGSLDSTAAMFGKKTGYYVATAFADDISPDGAWGAMLIRLGDSLITNWSNNPAANGDANVPRVYADGEAGVNQYKADLAKATLDAFKAMDLPEWVNNILDSVGETPTIEQIDEVIARINEMPAAILTSIGTSTEALSEIIYLGMQNSDPVGAGQAFADQITHGIEASLYQGFAQQITSIISTQLVTPVVTAMMAGSSITEAMANVSIDNMLKQAKAAAAALKAVINDEGFRSTLSELNAIVAESVSGSIGGFTAPASLASYSDSFKEVSEKSTSSGSSGQTEAEKEAERLDKSLADMAKEAKQLTAELLNLQGNSAEANRLIYELATEGMTLLETQAYDANQMLRQQIKELSERQGLERTLLQIQGNTAELRRQELAALQPANRALQEMIWLVEDATNALSFWGSVADTMTNAVTSATDRAMQVLLKSTQAEIKLLEDQKKTNNEEIQRLEKIQQESEKAKEDVNALFELLSSNIKELYGTVDSTSKQQEAFARRLILDAISSGVLPDKDKLAEAISTVRIGLDKSLYVTKFAQDKARLTFANELSDLQNIAGDQLTEAEQTVALHKRTIEELGLSNDKLDLEIEALNEQLEYWQDQIDIARNTYLETVEVRKAITALAEALNMEKQTQALINQNLIRGQGGASYNVSQQYGTNSAGQAFTKQGLLDSYQQHVSSGGTAEQIYYATAASGYTLADAERITGAIPGSFAREAEAMGLPAFDVGTDYVPRDMIAQIHEGEMIVPKAYNPNANPSLANNSNLEYQIEMLRYECRATATNTAKMTKLVERLIVPTDEGEALQTTAV